MTFKFIATDSKFIVLSAKWCQLKKVMVHSRSMSAPTDSLACMQGNNVPDSGVNRRFEIFCQRLDVYGENMSVNGQEINMNE